MGKNKYDYIYNSGADANIKDEMYTYIKYTNYGESDPLFSIEASKLHDALMYKLGLKHAEEDDRKVFSYVLFYIRNLKRRANIVTINGDWNCLLITIDDGGGEEHYAEIDFDDIKYGEGLNHDVTRYAIAYKSTDGVKRLKTDYRSGSHNGSSGYYTTQAVMDDDTRKKIYAMGLVPALMEVGSYHENWIYSVGIIPEYVNEVKRNCDYIFFDCKFQ
ncbi:MAG: hypothetical protein J6Y37_07565 [Paludibacteraceae bacterium]|nr:hypothetical protein [Paludibacteraceae bacterium]